MVLYRKLLKASYGLTDYNFKNYFIRRVREEARRGNWTTEKYTELLGVLER